MGSSRPCRGVWIAILLLAGGAVGVRAVELPVAVSPGDPAGSLVETRCPTFSWSAPATTRSCELVVYRVGEGGEEEEPILQQSFPGSVSSWTPSLDRCLERGGRYAWSVQALGEDGVGLWSAPSLFEVASVPDGAELELALEVVRRYLAQAARDAGRSSTGEDAAGAAAWTVEAGIARSAAPGSGPPAALAGVGGDPALEVNGAPVVTVSTFGAALCSALTYRYVDQGDGTVRDCRTGRVWLRDAGCLGTGTWSAGAVGGSVQRAVQLLNGGTEFSCSGYTAGSYTDWEVPSMGALCGAWDGSCTGTICCTAGEGLVDTAFSSPALGNAPGDGHWQTGDAFVGVQSGSTGYWSADDASGSNAWGVFFSNGLVVAGPESTAGRVWPVRGAP